MEANISIRDCIKILEMKLHNSPAFILSSIFSGFTKGATGKDSDKKTTYVSLKKLEGMR